MSRWHLQVSSALAIAFFSNAAFSLSFAVGNKVADVEAACGSHKVIEEMPITGRTFTHIKCPEHPKTGKLYGEGGSIVPAATYAAARKAEVQARYNAHGKLHDSALGLAAQCQAGYATEVPVVVWSALQPAPEQPIAPDVKPSAPSLSSLIALGSAQVSLLGLCASTKASDCRLFEHAPAAAMTVPCNRLKKLATDPDVAGIFPDDAQGAAGGNTFPYSVVALPLFWYGGSLFMGTGSGVCVLEPHAPSADSLPYFPGTVTVRPNSVVGTSFEQAHAATCGGVVKSTDSIGIAFGADLFFANYATTGATYAAQVQTGTNWCASTSARNWSFSRWVFGGSDVVQDMLFDYSAKQPPYPLIAVMSGNSGVNKVAAHRHILNGLVVGGSDENGSTVRANHTVWNDSSGQGSQSMNGPATDREVPDIVAPAKYIDAAHYIGWSGTSFAAPQVAAAGALLDQIVPALKSWPEGKRAILMAGANENLDSVPTGSWWQADGQDGVGEMNVNLAMTIAEPVHRHAMGDTPDRYGFDFTTVWAGSSFADGWLNGLCPEGMIGCTKGPGYRIRVPAAPTGLQVRVVLAWGGTACGGGAWNAACTSNSLDADFDLWVCKAGTQDCSASASALNNWEAAQFTGIPGQDYDVYVLAWDMTAQFTYLGLAWAVDNFSN